MKILNQSTKVHENYIKSKEIIFLLNVLYGTLRICSVISLLHAGELSVCRVCSPSMQQTSILPTNISNNVMSMIKIFPSHMRIKSTKIFKKLEKKKTLQQNLNQHYIKSTSAKRHLLLRIVSPSNHISLGDEHGEVWQKYKSCFNTKSIYWS